MDILFEIYESLPRQGPGEKCSTQKAFAMLKLPLKPSVLDIGCGCGMQTIEIAKLTDGTITAVDIYQPFLDDLKLQAISQGVAEKIKIVNSSMFFLDFAANSFDVIWSEGAIYIIGFEKGLKTWQPLLKTGGYIVVSELSWLKSNPPDEIKKYWDTNYPGIKTIENNLKLIEKSGYKLLDYFVLPESGWWDNYYTPLEKRIEILRKKYFDDTKANQVLDNSFLEIELYRNYSDWYGYVFYLTQLQSTNN